MRCEDIKVLGVIPARGGSKGVPKKNIRPLWGRPLIVHTINAAIESGSFVDVLVTTDSPEIRDIAIEHGAFCPFLRPPELSHDTALATDTIRHAVMMYEELRGASVDAVMMLQPTTPTRTSKHITECIHMLVEQSADAVMSVVKVDNAHPFKMKRIVGDRLVDFIETGLENPPRQSLPPVYLVNGAVYLVKRDVLVNQLSFKGKCVPYLMTAEDSINIDSEIDFKLAEIARRDD